MSAALAMASSIEAEFSNDHLACFVADHETHEAVYQAISARWPTATIQEGGLPVALSMMSQEPSPPLLWKACPEALILPIVTCDRGSWVSVTT